jgi:Zn-dependent protease with chaperone function
MWFNTQVLKRLCVICIASWAPAVESQAHDFLLCSLREKPALARSLNSHIGQANEILDRLAKVEVFSFNVQPARLTVTDLPVSTAFTRGAREIVISSRLLLSLDDSSELAFVLAHELSHIALGLTRRATSG